MIKSPNTVFSFLIFDAVDTWENLNKTINTLDTKAALKLKQVYGQKCKCIVIEREYIDKDYRDTFSQFHSKKFNAPSSRCIRLHFFSEVVTEEEIGASDDTDERDDRLTRSIGSKVDSIRVGDGNQRAMYFGYCVIRPTKPNCIGRTLVSHSLRIRQDAHMCVCREYVHILGAKLFVVGFPFISQDCDATVCAESALWMIFRYFSNRYPWYAEITPFQVTELTTHHAAGGRVYPSTGLYSWQMAESLRLHKFSPIIYSRKQYPHSFDHLLYTYIESGIPLLVTVPRHVVVALGHQSDYKKGWVPNSSGYTYTSHFNNSLIINDDGYFPYQLLWEKGPGQVVDSRYGWESCKHSGLDGIEEFIVPLPEKVFLTAEQVQTAIEALLTNDELGIKKRSELLSIGKVILRLFLTSSRAFKRSLRPRGMGDVEVERIYRNLPMPHFIWVCEMAEYVDYQVNRQVFGELIWDATRNAYEPDGWMALHYPEELIIDAGSALNRSPKHWSIKLSGKKSYSLFRSNLHSLE